MSKRQPTSPTTPFDLFTSHPPHPVPASAVLDYCVNPTAFLFEQPVYSPGAMAHLSLYNDDGGQFAKTAMPRPLPQRKLTADFELFGPSDSDDSFYHPATESIRPWDTSFSLDAHDHEHDSGLGAEPSDHSPSLLPVPDLIPDSPASPAMSYIPNPSLRPEFRSSSAPIPDQRGVRMNQLGQSLSDVYSPRAAHQHLGQSHSPLYNVGVGYARSSAGAYGGQASMSSFSASPNGAVQPGQLSSDYQATWDRLQYMNNTLPYTPAYTVQPLHTQPQYGSAYAAPPPAPLFSPHQQHRHLPQSSPHTQMLPPVSADDFRKTVSPQEAFLDYNDVDHALHSNALFHSSFGVGVGAGRGASLFAPLPSASAPSSAAVASSPRSIPDEPLRRRPAAATASPPARIATDRASSLPPPTQPSTTSAVRYGSRFAVPQNAVSWVDDDGDDEEEEEPEEADSLTAPSRVAGKKPFSRQSASGEGFGENAPVGGEAGIRSTPLVRGALSGKSLPEADLSSAVLAVSSHIPTPYATQSNSHLSRAPPPSTSMEDHSSAAAVPERLQVAPRVQASKNEDEESVPGDDDSDASDDTDEYVPTAAAPTSGGGRASSSRRKRSRPAPHADDFVTDISDDEDDEEEDAESGRASTSTRRKAHAQPPNKRRRRAPPPSSAATLNSPNAIRCDHPNGDGSVCGVIFRRPYDLARHKETIHGDGGKVKKEWVCDECHGSFSRKDALIRHARIRSHEAFST